MKNNDLLKKQKSIKQLLKNTAIILLIGLQSNLLFGQKVKISDFEYPLDISSDEVPMDFTDSTIYVCDGANAFYKFNNKLDKIEKVNYQRKIKIDDRKFIANGVLPLGGKEYIQYSNTTRNGLTLTYIEAGNENDVINHSPFIITKGSMYNKSGSSGDAIVSVSENSKFIGFASCSNNGDSLTMQTFDSNFKEVYTKSFRIPNYWNFKQRFVGTMGPPIYTFAPHVRMNKSYEVTKATGTALKSTFTFEVDNEGGFNIFGIISTQTNGDSSNYSDAPFIICYNKKNDELIFKSIHLKTGTVSMENKKAYCVTSSFNSANINTYDNVTGKIHMTGLIFNESGGGYYLLSFNARTNTSLLISENKFSEEIIKKINEYSTNIPKSILTGKGVDLVIKKLIVQDNGDIVIIYEIMQTVRVTDTGTSGQSLTGTTWEGKDILINYHQSNLDFNKSLVIEKDQKYTDMGSGIRSFNVLEKNTKLCFFYNPFQSKKDDYQFIEVGENGAAPAKIAYLRCFNDLSTSYDYIYFENSYYSSSDNCWFIRGNICHKSRIIRFDY